MSRAVEKVRKKGEPVMEREKRSEKGEKEKRYQKERKKKVLIIRAKGQNSK